MSEDTLHVENWPDIDIIIPTLNCKENLELCIERIKAQIYKGELNIFIVDGGSKDGTIEVGERYKCKITVIDGIYSDGKKGAKVLGASFGTGEFIWHIDSDNFLIGGDVAKKLVEPLIQHPECNISIPFNAEKPNYRKTRSKMANYLNEFTNRKEIAILRSYFNQGIVENGYSIIKDMEYGITNCSLIRRSAEEKVNFFDNDIELLKRLRKSGLSCAILVQDATFEQNYSDSFIHNGIKQARRLKCFARMGKKGLQEYFVDPEAVKGHFGTNFQYYKKCVKSFMESKDIKELYFLTDLILLFFVVFYSFPYLIKLIKISR